MPPRPALTRFIATLPTGTTMDRIALDLMYALYGELYNLL